MNFGMQGFHPATHDFGKAGVVRHLPNINTRTLEQLAGAAS